MIRLLITIDPGNDGALAWRTAATVPTVVDMPTLTIEAKKAKTKDGKAKVSREVDSARLARIVADLCRVSGCEAVTIGIEALPLMNVSGYIGMKQAANWGRVDGVCRSLSAVAPKPEVVDGPDGVTLVGGLTISVEIIDSRAWRAFHALSGEDHKARKQQAVARALALFPGIDLQGEPSRGGRRTFKDGRADALLMLEYLRAQVEREG